MHGFCFQKLLMVTSVNLCNALLYMIYQIWYPILKDWQDQNSTPDWRLNGALGISDPFMDQCDHGYQMHQGDRVGANFGKKKLCEKSLVCNLL